MSEIAEALEPLRRDPTAAAVLLDIDGTLAPIVRHASDALVPQPTRSTLISVAGRYGLVACVSGRRAVIARRIVSIGSIIYVGNHGCEVLPGGSNQVQVEPEVEQWTGPVRKFFAAVDGIALERLRVLREDKGPIVAFHWRGAPDEGAALRAIRELERDALAAGLAVHRGRKVLEVRPPVPIDKGRGIRSLLRGRELESGLYVGDDATDVDAFNGLRACVRRPVCVGVRSEETPAELLREADVMVDGPAGVHELLLELMR